jgi:hypothetical protein
MMGAARARCNGYPAPRGQAERVPKLPDVARLSFGRHRNDGGSRQLAAVEACLALHKAPAGGRRRRERRELVRAQRSKRVIV